jgi:kynureninase
MSTAPLESLEDAHARDASDPLHRLRDRFVLPGGTTDGDRPVAYLCGHSLGLAPRAARESVLAELERWENRGVQGHHEGPRPWIDYVEPLRAPLARLLGTEPRNVVAANSLTANLQLLLASFYRPTSTRRRILIEAGAFSSDRHAVESQLRLHGFDPARDLIEVGSEPDQHHLEPEAIERAIQTAGESLALVLWPGVQYRTGQVFDVARIVRAAHAGGALIGLDQAHAIGNVEVELSQVGADFAVWCSYKYLNGGPGAIGGLYVHPRHEARPRVAGWWGHERTTRFEMRAGFRAEAGAAGWVVSNPPILSSAALFASLAIFDEVTLPVLRRRSTALTRTLETSLLARLGERIEILTPAPAAQRGCQLSIRLRPGRTSRSVDARRVCDELARRDVIVDFRAPDVLRVAPVPLYNGCEDLWRFLVALDDSLGGLA